MLEDLQSSLQPFSDPATEMRVTSGKSTARLEMIREGKEHDYIIELASGAIIARHDNMKKYVNLGSLLASPGFADIPIPIGPAGPAKSKPHQQVGEQRCDQPPSPSSP